MATTPKNDWTQEEFIKAWVDSESLDEAKKKLKATSKQAVFLRAAKYRKEGIPLEKFSPKTAYEPIKVDVDAGIKLLAKLTNKSTTDLKKEGVKVAADIEKKRQEKYAKEEAGWLQDQVNFAVSTFFDPTAAQNL